MPGEQPREELGQKWRQAFGADAVGGRPAHAQEGYLRGSITARAATDAPCSVLNWWTTQQHQRVLTGVAGNGAELVQELALLASAGVGVARRQSPRQIVPTGLLPRAHRRCSRSDLL